MNNLEGQLEATTVRGAKNQRNRILKGLQSFFIQIFGDEEEIEGPSKKCFIDWGRELLDDVLNKNYIGIVVSLKLKLWVKS